MIWRSATVAGAQDEWPAHVTKGAGASVDKCSYHFLNFSIDFICFLFKILYSQFSFRVKLGCLEYLRSKTLTATCTKYFCYVTGCIGPLEPMQKKSQVKRQNYFFIT